MKSESPRARSDALTRMAQNKWELALLDIKMRGTDGIELQGKPARDRSRADRHHDDRLCVESKRRFSALKNGAYDYVSQAARSR